MPMKPDRTSSLCLAFALACQITACSGSSKNGGTAVLSGGEACSKIVAIEAKYKDLVEKDPAIVKNDPASMERVKSMIAEMELVAKEHTEFDCVISDKGETFDYNQEDLADSIAETKGTFGL